MSALTARNAPRIHVDTLTVHEANAMNREADRQFVEALRREYPEHDPARFDALCSVSTIKPEIKNEIL